MSAAELLFELPGSGRVLFTTRAHGNLSSVRGEGSGQAAAARRRLKERIGVERLALAHQVHGVEVHEWDAVAPAEDSGELEADGHATRTHALGLTVMSADCLPVALGAPGAIAMLHAGWRGLAGGILERGVIALAEIARADEMIAVLGPCAGECCYEVGPEVRTLFGQTPSSGMLNLRQIARDRLLAMGVGEVTDADACTICDERFFSHRREGARAGRQAGVAWLS